MKDLLCLSAARYASIFKPLSPLGRDISGAEAMMPIVPFLDTAEAVNPHPRKVMSLSPKGFCAKVLLILNLGVIAFTSETFPLS